jgi:hypothetical protein
MRLLLAATLVLVGAAGAGCASDQEKYCDAVEEHQAELGELAGEGGPSALLDALPIYRELQEQAPDDIADEWQQVVRSVEGLQEALDDAGVDPGTYDPEQPPEGVTEDQVAAIAAAADRVGSAETQNALQGLDQQARDVCHTPLSL